MIGTARHRRAAAVLPAVLLAVTVSLAACSAAPQRTPAPQQNAPVTGAVEPAGRITLSAVGDAVAETWSRVAGAQQYVLTAGGAGTVTVPAPRTAYRWAAARVPSDLTTATITARRFTVTATAHGRVLRRFGAEQACAPAGYVAARGSGQNGLLSEAYAGGLGSRGAAVLAGLRGDLHQDAARLPAVAVDYPATAVSPGTDLASLAAFLRNYRRSVAIGVADTVRIVTRTAAACPHTRLVLFGYSQGAQVIGSAYAALPVGLRARVADVVLFADPLYRPDDPRITYLPSRLSAQGILGARPALPDGGSTRVQSWCWREDIVCQAPPTGSRFHGVIYDSYQALAARLAARGLR